MDIKILRKYILIILVVFATVVCLIRIYRISPILGSDGIFMYSQGKVEKFQREQKNRLEYVCEYLSSIDSGVRWEDINPNILTFYNNNNNGGFTSYKVTIDGGVSTSIQELDENGLICILKESNCIQFVLWESLDSSCGLIYCNEEPIVNYNGKINIIPLSENNWYYYTRVAD